ncbi:hypothetical protein [Thalassospira sp. NFXS8]|uniref:hypothetical protein n=1 Tax=Thalassospira sp. NFXS8 TaxID=2819093 RepID=UPI0032DF3230
MAQPPLSSAPGRFTAPRQNKTLIASSITASRDDLLFLIVTLAGLVLTAGLLVMAPVAGLILVSLQCLASLLLVLRAVLVCRLKRGMK